MKNEVREGKRKYLIIPMPKYMELMQELTQEELTQVVHEGRLYDTQVVIDDTINEARLTNKLPPSITQKNVECRYIDYSALTLSDKVHFKQHTLDVQKNTETAFLSDFRLQGQFELLFDTKERAEAFMNAFFYYARLNPRIMPHWTSEKRIKLKYKTKQDRLVQVGGMIA
jgi:hypothetical protein